MPFFFCCKVPLNELSMNILQHLSVPLLSPLSCLQHAVPGCNYNCVMKYLEAEQIVGADSLERHKYSLCVHMCWVL